MTEKRKTPAERMAEDLVRMSRGEPIELSPEQEAHLKAEDEANAARMKEIDDHFAAGGDFKIEVKTCITGVIELRCGARRIAIACFPETPITNVTRVKFDTPLCPSCWGSPEWQNTEKDLLAIRGHEMPTRPEKRDVRRVLSTPEELEWLILENVRVGFRGDEAGALEGAKWFEIAPDVAREHWHAAIAKGYLKHPKKRVLDGPWLCNHQGGSHYRETDQDEDWYVLTGDGLVVIRERKFPPL